MKIDRVPILKNEDVLIVSVHSDLDDGEVTQFQARLLQTISKSIISGVVLDLSGVETLDLFLARKLMHLVNMVALMDVKSVIVGMRPTVAITLTEMDVTFPGVKTALNLDQGRAWLKRVCS